MSSSHTIPLRGLFFTPRSLLFEGRFGRMFRGLPAARFGKTDQDSVANLQKLAAAMMSDPDAPKDGKDEEESGIPSLYTYLGQFIDHDLTFDPASSLQKQNDPDALTDFRTPAFDLDCVYGRGPDDQPYMYGDHGDFLLGAPLTGAHPSAADLPRNPANGRALIGDPRNDENSIVSQLHGLFLRFHNRALTETAKSFADVQQFVRFHYQYVILNDFLPRIILSSVLDDLKLFGRYSRHKLEFFHWHNQPFMPVEFSGAAYRFGHSMVRPGYRLNDDGSTLLSIFPGLTGFEPMPSNHAIDWGRFVDTDIRTSNETSPVDTARRLQFAYRIDTSLVNPLALLPPPEAGTGPIVLAERNLIRAFRFGLPSGQDVARVMDITPLADKDILIGKAVDAPEEPLPNIVQIDKVFAGNCPLWTYVLAEAMHYREPVKIPVSEDVTVNTPKLGPVGGRIVAEVFLGLMFGDKNSLLNIDRNWQPPSGPNYTLKDFVLYALGA